MSDVKKTGLSVVNLQRLFKLDAPRDAVFKLLNALHHLGVVSLRQPLSGDASARPSCWGSPPDGVISNLHL